MQFVCNVLDGHNIPFSRIVLYHTKPRLRSVIGTTNTNIQGHTTIGKRYPYKHTEYRIQISYKLKTIFYKNNELLISKL